MKRFFIILCSVLFLAAQAQAEANVKIICEAYEKTFLGSRYLNEFSGSGYNFEAAVAEVMYRAFYSIPENNHRGHFSVYEIRDMAEIQVKNCRNRPEEKGSRNIEWDF